MKRILCKLALLAIALAWIYLAAWLWGTPIHEAAAWLALGMACAVAIDHEFDKRDLE